MIRRLIARRRQRAEIDLTLAAGRAVGLTDYQTSEVIRAYGLHYAARRVPIDWKATRRGVQLCAFNREWRP